MAQNEFDAKLDEITERIAKNLIVLPEITEADLRELEAFFRDVELIEADDDIPFGI